MLLEDISKYSQYSHKMAKVLCDYCQKQYIVQIKARYYGSHILAKDACKDCKTKKSYEVRGLKGHIWTDEEVDILKNKYQTCKNLSLIGINRSIKSIVNKAQKYGLIRDIHLANRTKGIDLNFDYFSDYNINSANIAGLIASDGNVFNKMLRISMIDYECVNEVYKQLNYKSLPIIVIPRMINSQKTYLASLQSTKICSDLKQYWNIVPKKSLILQPPPIEHLSLDIILSFIIGLIDGDGWIYTTKRNEFKLGFCGSKPIVEFVAKYLNIKNKIYKSQSIFAFNTQGKTSIPIYNRLKQVETPIKMYRKWKFNFDAQLNRLEDTVWPSL